MKSKGALCTFNTLILTSTFALNISVSHLGAAGSPGVRGPDIGHWDALGQGFIVDCTSGHNLSRGHGRHTLESLVFCGLILHWDGLKTRKQD